MTNMILMLLCVSTISFTQAQTDVRLAQTKMPLEEVARLQLPAIDNDALLERELEERVPGRAPGFAKNIAVDVSPETHGSWALTTDGQQVWRIRISSPEAKSLNLGFDQFDLPEGAKLLLYSPDYKTILGPFTPADEEAHGQLWTPVLPGDKLVIELQLRSVNRNDYTLHLNSVNHDFLGFGNGSVFSSGACHLDVSCGAADGFPLVDRYRDAIQSVAVYSLNTDIGSRFCTGFLVSNTRGDCTPFFLTANHCEVTANNAASLVVYWNYFNDPCRQPNSTESGTVGNGDLSDFNIGAIHRASYTFSDFTLVELDDPVSPTANAWFAGWDVSDNVTTDTVFSVHHPDGDEKRISFEFDGVSVIEETGQGEAFDGNFLLVEDWDIGTTEPGSSGGPLFNKQGQAIGKLTLGEAACGNDEFDAYGWLHASWEGGGEPNSRLRDWLDPDNTGILVQDGYYPVGCSLVVSSEPITQEVCASEDVVYQISVNDEFQGAVNLSVDGLTAGLEGAFTNPIVQPGGVAELRISGTENISAGVYGFSVIASDSTSTVDTDLSFNLVENIMESPNLNMPTEDSTLSELNLTLSWDAVINATVYNVEVAHDEDFTNIALMQETTETSLAIELETEGQYYWRVTARNVCGQLLSEFRRFDVLLVDTYEIGEASLRVFPNPTHEQVQIELTTNLGGQLDIQLYSTSGQLVQQWQLPAQAGRQSLRLHAVPAGVYWLQIRNADYQAVEKLIVY